MRETTLDKRTAILDAALALFNERGFQGTAVPLIAERAGVAAGTIYRYFESKEALVNALYQLWKTRLHEMIVTDFPFEAGFREQFRVFWQRLTTFALTYPEAYSFQETHYHSAYLDATSRALAQELHVPVYAFLEAGVRQGITKPLPVELSIALVMGQFAGVFKACQSGRLPMSADTFASAEACAWDCIRA